MVQADKDEPAEALAAQLLHLWVQQEKKRVSMYIGKLATSRIQVLFCFFSDRFF